MNTVGIAARRRAESAEQATAAAKYVDMAGTAKVGYVVVIAGHKNVDFTLAVIDETIRKANVVDPEGDDPPPMIKAGRGKKKTRAPKGSWEGVDKSVFLPNDDLVCVKYYEPLGGSSLSRFSFPQPPQIVWVHARLVRKVLTDSDAFTAPAAATSSLPRRRTRSSPASAALPAGIKYIAPQMRAQCVAACEN